MFAVEGMRTTWRRAGGQRADVKNTLVINHGTRMLPGNNPKSGRGDEILALPNVTSSKPTSRMLTWKTSPLPRAGILVWHACVQCPSIITLHVPHSPFLHLYGITAPACAKDNRGVNGTPQSPPGIATGRRKGAVAAHLRCDFTQRLSSKCIRGFLFVADLEEHLNVAAQSRALRPLEGLLVRPLLEREAVSFGLREVEESHAQPRCGTVGRAAVGADSRQRGGRHRREGGGRRSQAGKSGSLDGRRHVVPTRARSLREGHSQRESAPSWQLPKATTRLSCASLAPPLDTSAVQLSDAISEPQEGWHPKQGFSSASSRLAPSFPQNLLDRTCSNLAPVSVTGGTAACRTPKKAVEELVGSEKMVQN